MDMRVELKMCSFCGAAGSQTNPLSGGLGAMICFPCIETMHEEISSPAQVEAMARPVWDEMDDTAVLASLTSIARSAAQAADFEREWVQMLRGRGLSWTRIGQALSISRQAAWERFSKTPGRTRAG